MVIHVGELDGFNGAWWLIGVDEAVDTASREGIPLEVRSNVLNGGKLIIVQSSCLVRLATSQLRESLHSLLDNLNNVSLETMEVVLNSNQIITVVVLSNNLAVQTV
jgi:hypothetical protein